MIGRWFLCAGAVAVVAFACLLAGYSAGAQEAAPKGTPNSLLPGQVMKVGDTVITSEEFIARLWDAETLLKPENRQLGNQLAYLQNNALLNLEAKRLGGLSFSQEELAAETARQWEMLRAQVKSDSRGMLTVEDWLKQLGMTTEQFDAYLRERVPVILQKRVLVNYFEQTEPSIDCSHILVTKRERAEDLHKRLEDTSAAKLTEVFEDLAVQHSEDPAAGVTQGRLPRIYQNDGTLVPEAAEALWALKNDEFSGPVKTEFGYHIFLRRATYSPKKVPLAELRNELIKAQTRVNEEDYFNRWVRWVFNTQKYKVERRLPGYDCKPDRKIGE